MLRKGFHSGSRLLVAAFACFSLAGLAHAADVTLGDLEIAGAHIGATMPGAPVAGGYLTIRNHGETPDRLVSVSAPFAGMAEVHEMKMDGEVMKMRPVEGGLELPPGGEVVLDKGGYHLMFMHLHDAPEKGATAPVTLTFEKAGEVEVPFDVE